jgi:hypothetical protein
LLLHVKTPHESKLLEPSQYHLDLRDVCRVWLDPLLPRKRGCRIPGIQGIAAEQLEQEYGSRVQEVGLAGRAMQQRRTVIPVRPDQLLWIGGDPNCLGTAWLRQSR